MSKSGLQVKSCMDDFLVQIPQQMPSLLQSFRKSAGLTQEEVAAQMGIAQQTLSALERNADSVTIERLMRLLPILGVDLVLRRRKKPAPQSEGDW